MCNRCNCMKNTCGAVPEVRCYEPRPTCGQVNVGGCGCGREPRNMGCGCVREERNIGCGCGRGREDRNMGCGCRCGWAR